MTASRSLTIPFDVIDELVQHNSEWAKDFAFAGLPTAPSHKLAIVVCMDSRIDVFAVLGLDIGQAHVIRNAGGIATDDVIRSIAISQRFLGTDHVLLIQHTRCGMATFSDQQLADDLERETGVRPDWTGAFTDIDDSVRRSVQRIRESPFIEHREQVWGTVYDVETGLLRLVTEPSVADESHA